MIEINKEIMECDVLIAGGGIAGLMAGIAAADKGAKVILCDKNDTRRSGSGATGNDHFNCYIPEYHGDDTETWLKEFRASMVGGYSDIKIQRKFMERSFEVVQDWHEWGINMKPHGFWEFNGHAMPNRMRVFLKYDGQNQKAVLTKEARKRGVIIQNKTPITEFLVDDKGAICGAVAITIDKKEPQIKVFKSKVVISATGNTSRLYPADSVYNMFNSAHCPCNAGGGRAAAYKVGAKLVNLEIPNTHAGPKNFERCGKATWIGIIADSEGKPLGPFVTKPDKELGDVTADVWHGVFRENTETGRGPVFMNCTETSPEDMAYMRWGLVCEGDTSLLDAMDKQGIDLGKHMVEFTQYTPMLIGRGIQIDENGATNVPGLYAAGDEVGNFRSDMAGAAVIGRFAGEEAAEYIKTCELVDKIDMDKVAELQELYSSFMDRKEGAQWQELNAAVQQTLDRYAGIKYVRSETMLNQGYKYLEDVKNNALNELKCNNAHELMRALESFDLLLIGQLICTTAKERKECRGMHKRAEYTYTNPLLDGMFLTIQKGENGDHIMEWRSEYK
ncbi:MAG: FAD-binding protein [Anaerovoracaceae bacterium]|jgi:succinate dehydrogenase/fumarate reductase flavoprotein subunit